ncbi:acetyl esterase/lipase [Bacilli bacterium PM5-3]|nr:acetyl esterase/lipase [Bacilli bacterium PM5-3]MDH6603038.1 acetyl esterase/lipase [Bacilli bacterium PM5-9]
MKKNKLLIILFLLVCFLYLNNTEIYAKKYQSKYITLKSKKNLKYNNISKKQKLDIYYPKKIKRNRNNPVVLFIHGGYYDSGNKAYGLKKNKKNYNDAGYVYVTMNYRLSKNARFPSAANDVKTAIRYLKHNSKKLYINSSKIIIVGFSAGANVGSLAVSTPNIKSFNNEKVKYAKMNNKVAGFIGISGFYNLDTYFDLRDKLDTELIGSEENNTEEEINNETEENIDEKDDSSKEVEPINSSAITISNNVVSSGAYTKNQKRILNYFTTIKTPIKNDLKNANTFNYIKKIKAPIMIYAGKNDKTISYKQSSEFCSTLKKNNKKVSCHIYKKKSHGISFYQKKDNFKKIVKWMNKITRHKK